MTESTKTGAKFGLVFDPRTKLFYLITMTLFVLGGMGQNGIINFTPILAVTPFILLFLSGRIILAVKMFLIYAGVMILFVRLSPHISGFWGFVLLGSTGIATKFMPTIVTGAFLVTTTTVSEFTAAMTRARLSDKIIIPLAVMFRFFPTVINEAKSINAAMKMRGISLGGGNVGKFFEYRIVPLMTCSVRLGEELSAAALTRGLGGEVRRTNVCKIGMHAQDYVLLLFCASAYVVYALTLLGYTKA